MKIICLLKTIWYNKNLSCLFDGAYIDGHSWVEDEDGFLTCEVCGKVNEIHNITN